MSQQTIWVDCGCCGRTHADLPLDCRAFANCENCGDAYSADTIQAHLVECDGVPQSGLPEAQFADENAGLDGGTGKGEVNGR